MSEPVYMTQIRMKAKATDPEHVPTKEDLDALKAEDVGAAEAEHTHAVADVEGLAEALAEKASADLADYPTKTELTAALADLPTKTEMEDAIEDAMSGLVSEADLEAAVEEALGSADIDLSGYVTEEQLEDAVAEAVADITGTDAPDLSNYVTQDKLEDALEGVAGSDALDGYVTEEELATALEGVAGADELTAVQEALDGKADVSALAEYAKTADLPDMTDYAKAEDIPDLTGYAKTEDIPDLSGYAKTEDLPEIPEHTATEQAALDSGITADLVEKLEGLPPAEYMMVPELPATWEFDALNDPGGFFPTVDKLKAIGTYNGNKYTAPENGFVNVFFWATFHTAAKSVQLAPMFRLYMNDRIVEYKGALMSPAVKNDGSAASITWTYGSQLVPVRKGDTIQIQIQTYQAYTDVVQTTSSRLYFAPTRAIEPKMPLFTDKGSVETAADLPATAADFDTYHIKTPPKDVYARHVDGALTWQPVRTVTQIESARLPDYRLAARTTLAANTVAATVSRFPKSGALPAGVWTYGDEFTVEEDGFVWGFYSISASAAYTHAPIIGLFINGVSMINKAMPNLLTSNLHFRDSFGGPYEVKAGDKVQLAVYPPVAGTYTLSTSGFYHLKTRAVLNADAVDVLNSHIADDALHAGGGGAGVTQTDIDNAVSAEAGAREDADAALGERIDELAAAIPDVSGFLTEDGVDDFIDSAELASALEGYAKTEDLPDGTVDLSAYPTTEEVEEMLDDYVHEADLPDITNMVDRDALDTELSVYAKTADVAGAISAATAGLASEEYVDDALAAIPAPDLSTYAKTVDVDAALAGKAGTAAATTAANGLMSAADKSKLDGVESGAQANAVTSVAGRTGAVTLAASDIGLGNVNNTADADKPVSTAAQAALDLKADASALSSYATTAAMNTALAGKANTTDIPDLAPYAKTADVTTALAGKADASAIPKVKVYAGTVIGNGSAVEFTVTHNLGTRSVSVKTLDGDGNEVVFDVQAVSETAVKLTAVAAPANGSTFTVIIMGVTA